MINIKLNLIKYFIQLKKEYFIEDKILKLQMNY